MDVPFLTITPGTRDGMIRDEQFTRFLDAMKPLEKVLAERIQEQEKAEEERASRNILKSVQTALREAIMDLPPEEYDWFDIYENKKILTSGKTGKNTASARFERYSMPSESEEAGPHEVQKQFFEFASPLFSARIHPTNSMVAVSGTKLLRAIGMDKARRVIDDGLNIE
ncbi:MAG: hypothetical protein NC930_07145, partial [Candidatus Omnitrophica bacterium]|nr:hypothetical protein [Candidatus Omnitrophota bacterium]